MTGDCQHVEWWTHDFALLALPEGRFRSEPRILRCRDCGVMREVEIARSVHEEVREAWRRYESAEA